MIFIGKVMTYFLFYGIAGIIILSFFQKNKAQTEWLSKESTQELKGVAILMVLLGHMTYMFGLISIPLTPALGAPAVDLFLFLSGFGLMISYEKNGLKGFWKRRAGVIIIPYILITLLKIPYMIFILHLEIVEIFKNLLALSVSADTSMWYIQYIILCYIVFYTIFSIPKLKKESKMGILFGISCILVVLYGWLFYNDKMPVNSPLNESYSHHLSFSIGVLVCFFYKKINTISFKRCIGIAIAFFVVVQFFAFPGIDGYIKYYINNICYVFVFVFLWGAIKKKGKSSKLLSYLGGLSYYIYLNELVVMKIVYDYTKFHEGWKACVIVCISIFLAIPTKWIGERIFFLFSKK